LKFDLAKTIYGIAPKQYINMSEFTEMLNMMLYMMTAIMIMIGMIVVYVMKIEYDKLRRWNMTLMRIAYTPEVQEDSQEEANPVIDELMAEPALDFNELPAEDEPVVDWVQEMQNLPAPEFNELPAQQVLPEPEVRLLQGAVGEQGAVYRVVWQNPPADLPFAYEEEVLPEYVNVQEMNQNQTQPQRRQRRRTQRPARVNHTSVKNTKKYARENNLVGENCPICLEEFKSQCTLHKTRCNHHFHPKCLRQLKEQYQNRRRIRCPMCRTNL
jgi:hypothetical protein